MDQIPTVQLIFQYLVNHPPATARQISQALHITVTDVRYHLQNLVQSGQIRCIGVAPNFGAGRPALTYQANQSTPTATLFLLLQSVFEINGEDLTFYSDVAKNLIPHEITSSSIPAIRISKTVQFLSSLGYQARWESRLDNPVVEFRSCPYQTTNSEREHFCSLDREILTIGTGYACNVISLQTSDQKYCQFELRSRQA